MRPSKLKRQNRYKDEKDCAQDLDKTISGPPPQRKRAADFYIKLASRKTQTSA
ncbi:hypothetical protein GCWU000325_02440 [Alloprevotella tannerae ATCC 51259]|uniref:Uncharacterized protein n=1 Tax=Alloprevotella tannerae ATCC 51259 TaxID=626522 RepID=C9LJM7_9BACT|nr:hypothetical protein GCWU000325_02440 [Alloprevotella tannerae ATCC 51259]